MAAKHIHIDRSDSYVPTDSQLTDEEVTHGWNFSREAARRGTTVESVVWTNEHGDNMTIAGQALTSGLATATLSSSHAGNSMIRTTCTFADGSTRANCIAITVLDPQTATHRGYC